MGLLEPGHEPRRRVAGPRHEVPRGLESARGGPADEVRGPADARPKVARGLLLQQ